MKGNEKRAIERAIYYLLSAEGEVTEAEMPYKALRLAQLRAGRCYDTTTAAEGLDYAKSEVKKAFSGIVYTKR